MIKSVLVTFEIGVVNCVIGDVTCEIGIVTCEIEILKSERCNPVIVVKVVLSVKL